MDANLEKDPAILSVLGLLYECLGKDAFVIADHWQTDLCAIGIASPHNLGVLAYISCYAEANGHYDYELELPPLNGDDSLYRVAGRGSGLSFEKLADVISVHLKHA